MKKGILGKGLFLFLVLVVLGSVVGYSATTTVKRAQRDTSPSGDKDIMLQTGESWGEDVNGVYHPLKTASNSTAGTPQNVKVDVESGNLNATTTVSYPVTTTPITWGGNSTLTYSNSGNNAVCVNNICRADYAVNTYKNYTFYALPSASTGVQIQIGQSRVIPSPQNVANALWSIPVGRADIDSNCTANTAESIYPYGLASAPYFRPMVTFVAGTANNSTLTMSYSAQ